VWYQRGYINRSYNKGWFVDLGPFLSSPNPYVSGNPSWRDIFDPRVIESGMAPDGHIYILTADIVGTGIFYNRDMFGKAGISEGKTWVEFIAIQKKLKAAGYIPFAMDAGSNPMRTDWAARVIQDVVLDSKMGKVKGTGGRVERTLKPGGPIPTQEVVRAILSKDYTAQDPQWQEQYVILKDWSKYWQSGFTNANEGTIGELWLTGKAAMVWLGSWSIKPVDVDPLRKFDYGVFEGLPTITRATTKYAPDPEIPAPAMGGVGGVFQYGVSHVAKKKGTAKEAIDWLMFITAPQNLVPLMNDQGGFQPGLKDAKGVDGRMAPFSRMLLKSGAERIEPYDSMLTREFFGAWYKIVQGYLVDKLTLRQLADQVQGEMEKGAKALAAEHPEWR